MRRTILALLLVTGCGALYAQVGEKSLFVQASAGIGSGMYIGGGAEYIVIYMEDILPIDVAFGGMGNVRFVPLTGSGYSGLGVDLMGTVHYSLPSLPRLDLFLGTGFGYIHYTGYGDNDPPIADGYITFALAFAGAWELTRSLSVTVGFAGYPGEFLCVSAGVRLGL